MKGKDFKFRGARGWAGFGFNKKTETILLGNNLDGVDICLGIH